MKALRIVLTIVITFVDAGPTLAQSWGRGGDVAVQAALLRPTDANATSAGVGGRLTFDLSPWAALDAEISFFPNDDFNQHLTIRPSLTGTLAYHRQRTEGFLGLKVGRRWDRGGLFAKARPGFTRLVGKGLGCSGDPCALILVVPPNYRAEFAFDLGAVVEFYPSARIVTRADFGDVMIRHRSTSPPCPRCTSHNFTSRLGVGFRF